MSGHICFAVNDNCWNLYESYGMICVHCGCCSKYKKKRQKARLELMERRLAENESFNYWFDDEELRKTQEKNVKINRAYYKRKIRYYKSQLKDGDTK